MAVRREKSARGQAGNGPELTLGVEEEFFLVDPDTLDLRARPDAGILQYCERHRGRHGVVPEFLRSQIETNTRVCASVAEVREALGETRQLVIEAAERYRCLVLATSTHPFAAWRAQAVTKGPRYESFAMIYQQAVRQLLVGGMHIHAGFGDADSRVRVMTAMRRYLPVLHALSGSSPFSGGNETGFKSYRLTIMGDLPRTGLPRSMGSWQEFSQIVEGYRRMRFIGDASELWWDIRPSVKHGTLELRICDVCSRASEAIAIVALFASLVRHLVRRDAEGTLPAEPPTELIAENRWIASRYGLFAFLGDTEDGGRNDIYDVASRLVEDLSDDARSLGCEAELRAVLDILRHGSSADRQVDHFRLRRLESDTVPEALRSVVKLMVAETKEPVGRTPRS